MNLTFDEIDNTVKQMPISPENSFYADKRYRTLWSRLNELTNSELRRLMHGIRDRRICYDTWNYNSENNSYCPLSYAIGLADYFVNPSDELIKRILSNRFNPVNVIKGIEGNYFTNNREEDLRNIVAEILVARKQLW